jgi:uncharacterized protein
LSLNIFSRKMLIQRQTSLTANIVAFCRYLRTEGFHISATEEADALRAVELMEAFQTPELLRGALHAVLVRTPAQSEHFDGLYDYYWQQLEKAVNSKQAEQGRKQPKRSKPKPQEPQFEALKDWLFGKQNQEEELDLYTYSAAEALGERDFSTLSDAELGEMFELIQMIAKRLARQQNRRYKNDKNGALDLRKTLRVNLRRGGEIVELARRKPQRERLELVLICDVSKSMELYSRFLVQFAYCFQSVFKRIDTFVFSTNLLKISDILRGPNFENVLKNLSQNVPNWSGGTRIGESLETFVTDFGTKNLTSKSVVIIVSDGWETGDVSILSEAMQQIHRRAHRVIWLNPLAGNPNYEPTTAAMSAAMPFVDVFAAAHNAASLRRLSRVLR